jgi:hypothetical protein
MIGNLILSLILGTIIWYGGMFCLGMAVMLSWAWPPKPPK